MTWSIRRSAPHRTCGEDGARCGVGGGREEERKRGRGEEGKIGSEEDRKRGREEERKIGREEEGKRGKEISDTGGHGPRTLHTHLQADTLACRYTQIQSRT